MSSFLLFHLLSPRSPPTPSPRLLRQNQGWKHSAANPAIPCRPSLMLAPMEALAAAVETNHFLLV